MLSDFIENNRDELIGRCEAKVAARSSAVPPSDAVLGRGVAQFLDQLKDELRGSTMASEEIDKTATRHGHDLFLRGCSISEVVHDYGNVCQAITDLAVERGAPVTVDDFRTLNRCLDDAIAGAVTEYAHEQNLPRAGESHQLWNLINMAITGFEVLRTGHVGVSGNTGTAVHRNLMAIRAALASRQNPDAAALLSLDEYAVRR